MVASRPSHFKNEKTKAEGYSLHSNQSHKHSLGQGSAGPRATAVNKV